MNHLGSIAQSLNTTLWLVGLLFTCQFLHAQDNGRYQLLTAVLEHTSGVPVTRVFKLDTATGRSWVYQLGGGQNPTGVGQWVEIPDPTSPENSRHALGSINGQRNGDIQTVPNKALEPPGETTKLEDPGTLTQVTEVPKAVVAQQTDPPETQPTESPKAKQTSMKNIRSQLDEYNRIIQWANANSSGAWVPDGKGGQAYMKAEDMTKLKTETEIKKKNLLEGLRFFGRPRPNTANPSP